jgi:hypothetical protein
MLRARLGNAWPGQCDGDNEPVSKVVMVQEMEQDAVGDCDIDFW